MTDEEILKEVYNKWIRIVNEREGIYDFEDVSEMVKEAITLTREAERKRILELIDEFSNPYPKDIFLWDNKEKRFNQHCFEIVENIREALKKEVER